MSDQTLPISPKPSSIAESFPKESDSIKSEYDETKKEKINQTINKPNRPKIKQTARKAISRVFLSHLNFDQDKDLDLDENFNYMDKNLNQKLVKTKQTARKRCTPYIFPKLKKVSQPIVVTEIDEDYYKYSIESNSQMKQTARKKISN